MNIAEYKRQWALRNIDKVRASARAYYYRNKEKCKQIAYKWQNKNWERFLKKQREYRRKRYRTDPDYAARIRAYNKKGYQKYRAKYLVYNAKRRMKIKYKSVTLMNNAIRKGDLIRPDNCESCHKKCVPHGHHHRGYNRPYDVIWLCSLCHATIHHRD